MRLPLPRVAAVGGALSCALVAAGFLVVPAASAAPQPDLPPAPLGITQSPFGVVTPAPFIGTDGRVIVSPNDPGIDEVISQFLAEFDADPQVQQAINEAAPGADRRAEVTPAPAAEVPDPLAFDSYPADPVDYLIPPAAKQYQQGAGYKIPAPTPGGPNAGAVVPGLEAFYGQNLDWQKCADYDPAGGEAYAIDGIECAYLIVPVDYSKPDGPTAAIGLLKYPAANQANKIGTIFADPGGPGGSGMGLAVGFAENGLPDDLHNNFDVIGFDPRGVGSSLPMIRCKSSAAFDAQRAGSDKLTGKQLDQIRDRNTQDCYTNTGKAFGIDGESFIANVGTKNVVRDLDIARAAVGDAKINYLGYSYGTSIGYQYAMAFPENIRALVIDGVVNPFENNPNELKKYEDFFGTVHEDPFAQIRGFQATFEQFMRRCAADDGFTVGGEKLPCALGTSGDLTEMMKNYQAISQLAWGGSYYETKEQDAAKRRPLSFADTVQGTIMSLYSERLWPLLNLALTDLKARQDGSMMLRLADLYYSRDKDGHYSFEDSAFQTIWCTDAGVTEGSSGADALEAQYEAAPFTDPGKNPDGTRRGDAPGDWCAAYKAQFTLPKGVSLDAMPNVLVISTTYDPATPYPSGVLAALGLKGTLLTVAGNSHTSFLGASKCTDAITVGYFNSLVVATDIPGKTGVETKDPKSQLITGNECQVTSFRPTFELSSASVVAGETAELTATGLVRGGTYEVQLPAGVTLADAGDKPVVKAGPDGTVKFTVRVAKDVAPGDFKVQLVPAANENDPLVKPAAGLTVKPAGSAPVPPATDPTTPSTQPTTPTSTPPTATPMPERATANKEVLATTGANGLPLAAVGILLLVVAGSTLLLVQRRRSAR